MARSYSRDMFQFTVHFPRVFHRCFASLRPTSTDESPHGRCVLVGILSVLQCLNTVIPCILSSVCMVEGRSPSRVEAEILVPDFNLHTQKLISLALYNCERQSEDKHRKPPTPLPTTYLLQCGCPPSLLCSKRLAPL